MSLQVSAASLAVGLRSISKTYGNIVANRAVDLDVGAGTVHGLLGENGAGKSTLMKILFGIVRPDRGTIDVGGARCHFRSPADALAAGVGMVQQHFSLVQDFTVAENVVLGSEHRRGVGLLDRRRAVRATQLLADRFGFRLDVTATVGDLAVGAQQRVEILKALRRGARVLILDEPTAALAPPEVVELFSVVRQFVAAGHTAIFISHKLAEVTELCDEVTVLRDGAVVHRRAVMASVRDGEDRKEFESELAQAMVGRRVPPLPGRQPVVTTDVLSLRGAGDGDRLGPLDLDVRGGEIVGVAGVEGNGQTELIELVLGVRRCRRGTIGLLGRDVTRWAVARRLNQGLGHIAEDRHATGIAVEHSLIDNCLLGFQGSVPYARGPLWMSQGEARRLTGEIVRDFDVRTRSLRSTVDELSGGNQQKLVVGRELGRGPKLMIAGQPTRGLDIAATARVHRELLALRGRGAAVLLVSLDLNEVLTLADRIIVMYGGVVAGQGRPATLSTELLGRWMTGRDAA